MYFPLRISKLFLVSDEKQQQRQLHFSQHCDGLDNDQSFDITVSLRPIQRLDSDIVMVWLR